MPSKGKQKNKQTGTLSDAIVARAAEPFSRLVPPPTPEWRSPAEKEYAPHYKFVMGTIGPWLFECLRNTNRQEAIQGFRRMWDVLHTIPTSLALLRLPKKRTRGRKQVLTDFQAKTITLVMDWGGLSARDVLLALDMVKPGEKVIDKERGKIYYWRKRGRAACDPNTFAKELKLDGLSPRREWSILILRVYRERQLASKS
jgi:hypothetical protein